MEGSTTVFKTNIIALSSNTVGTGMIFKHGQHESLFYKHIFK